MRQKTSLFKSHSWKIFVEIIFRYFQILLEKTSSSIPDKFPCADEQHNPMECAAWTQWGCVHAAHSVRTGHIMNSYRLGRKCKTKGTILSCAGTGRPLLHSLGASRSFPGSRARMRPTPRVGASHPKGCLTGTEPRTLVWCEWGQCGLETGAWMQSNDHFLVLSLFPSTSSPCPRPVGACNICDGVVLCAFTQIHTGSPACDHFPSFRFL